MFFSLALVLSSLSITYGTNNVPINVSPVPSGIYATAIYSYDTDLIKISIYNYDDYHSQTDYLRVYCEKTVDNTTYKPIIAQCNYSSTQYDHYDVANFGFGYYGGNNNLACRFVLDELNDTYYTKWISQWRYDNFYDGISTDGDAITGDADILSLDIYIRSNFEDETEYNFVTGLIDGNIYNNGYDDGYDSGYSSGYHDGSEDGYDSGFDDGRSAGYQEGFYEGVGDSSMQTIFSGIVQIGMLPVNVFLKIFEFEIFGIDIGAFVSGLLTIALIVIILRSVFGGGGKND